MNRRMYSYMTSSLLGIPLYLSSLSALPLSSRRDFGLHIIHFYATSMAAMSCGTNLACSRAMRNRMIDPTCIWRNTRPFHASTLHRARQQDHYHVLGLTKNSSKRDVKNKYYEVRHQYPLPVDSASLAIHSRPACMGN
jgi:hypothetical protein